MNWKHLSTALFAALMFIPVAQAASDEPVPPPEGEEFEQAAIDFLTWCGPCHGREGDGTGPVASTLRAAPPDLRFISRRNEGKFPSEMVRQRIDGRNLPAAHGTAEMPIWGYWFTQQTQAEGTLQDDQPSAEKEVQDRIDRLVEYLAILQQ